MTDSTKLQDLLIRAAAEAIEGTLDDSTRVPLLRLALTIAADEFYRVEQISSGIVKPEVLMILHQIYLLCDEDVDPERLLGEAQGVLDEFTDELAEEESG